MMLIQVTFSGRLDLGIALVETENSETDSLRTIWTPTFLWQFLCVYIYIYIYTCLLNHFSCVQLCETLWTVAQPTRFLCPWDSPVKNTAVGCCALLQEIFLTGANLSRCLLHWQMCSLPLAPSETRFLTRSFLATILGKLII